MAKRILSLFKSTAKEWKKNNPLFLGAGISFYVILSLGPILVVLMFLMGALYGQNGAEGEIIEQIRGVVGDKPAEAISTIIQHASTASGKTIALLSSIPLIFFGSTMVFFQIRYALNIIFESEENGKGSLKDTIKKYSFSFLMLLILGSVLFLLIIKDPLLSILKDYLNDFLPVPWVLFRIVEILFSFALLVFVFFMVYYILPDKKMEKKDILIGSLVTAFLFTIVQYLIGLNAENSNIDSAYGAIGSATILLLWIFYSSLIFLFGASFTKVISRKNTKTLRRSSRVS
jgi:membrane protein